MGKLAGRYATMMMITISITLTRPFGASALTLFTDRALWEAAAPGFGLTNIAAQVPEGEVLNAGDLLVLTSGVTLAFNSALEGAQVPTTWASWSDGKNPAVLFTGANNNSVTGTYSAPVAFFGLEAQPNNFGSFDMMLLLNNGSSLLQTVSSLEGAKFFGWTDGAISSFTLSCTGECEGFAFGELSAAVPEPSSVVLLAFGIVGIALAARQGRKLTNAKTKA